VRIAISLPKACGFNVRAFAPRPCGPRPIIIFVFVFVLTVFIIVGTEVKEEEKRPENGTASKIEK
jgi:hypothetical protein